MGFTWHCWRKIITNKILMLKNIFSILLLLVGIHIHAQIPSGYYNSATGSGYTLKSQLKTIIDNVNDNNGQSFHDINVTYSQLWNLFENSDVRDDGKVWDVYSNCDFVFGEVEDGGDQDNGSGGNSECDKFNREHTFPQSWYDDGSHPMKADAFHVLPSDKKVNSIRGNLAFSEVDVPNYTSQNGSKRGTSSIVGPTSNVFEPVDEFKGDIARGFFYVATRYEDEIGTWENNDSNGDSMLDGSGDKVFETWAIQMLYNWHINDPVSQKEIDRNNVIFNHQNNRNPFIDHPEYVQNIWGTVLSETNYSLDKKTSIYPNPATENYIYVRSNEKVTVKIFSLLGKKLIQNIIEPSNNKMDISIIKSGVYIIKISNNSSSITRKFIKK